MQEGRKDEGEGATSGKVYVQFVLPYWFLVRLFSFYVFSKLESSRWM